MTRKEFLEKIEESKLPKDPAELYLFIPSINEILYMQAGDGGQLDGDCDDDGNPYEAYIDYAQYACESPDFEEVDAGIYMFHPIPEEEEKYGVLVARMYELFCVIYGSSAVTDEDFDFLIFTGKRRETVKTDDVLYEVVGLDDLEGTVFAHCTSDQLAEEALSKLVDAEWDEDMLTIRKSNLAVNTIVLDDEVIHLGE